MTDKDDFEKKLNELIDKLLSQNYNFTGPGSYILVDGVPVPARSILEWGRFMEDMDRRRIAWTEGNGIQVSTVFTWHRSQLRFFRSAGSIRNDDLRG
jgi:hypothetical protein